MRRLLFFCAALWMCLTFTTLVGSAGPIKKINPALAQCLLLVENRIGAISDQINPVMVFNSDVSSGAINLNAAGNYQLAEDVIATVSITASQVSLNLAQYKITATAANANGVAVMGVSNVRIANGFIQGASVAGSSGCGVLVNAGSSNIIVQDVTLTGHGKGVSLVGTSSVNNVNSCTLNRLNYVLNDIGMYGVYAYANSLKKCVSLYSRVAGFSLLSCEANCFYDCAALKTGGDSGASSSVFGFSSSGGTSNLFMRCAAQQTKCGSNTFGDKACGFILTGSEQKTKILSSIITETDALSSPTAMTYGIQIAPTFNGGLTAVSGFPVTFASERHPAVAWSPDGQYCAMTRVHTTEVNGVTMFGWNGASMSQISSFTGLTALPNAITWSPDGKYVVAVDGASGAGRIYAYMVEGGVFNALFAGGLAANPAAELQAVKFSPDGRMIVCHGYKSGTGSYWYTYAFNPSESVVSNRITLLNYYFLGVAATNFLTDWSPDGQWIASTAGGSSARVWAVLPNGAFGTFAGASVAGAITAKWSPSGRYLAVGGTGSVTVFVFNGSALGACAQMTGLTSTAITGLDWSPDGKYIAAGSSDTGTPANNRIWTLYFSGTQLTLAGPAQTVSNKIDSLAWSPDGKYIVASEYTGATASKLYVYNAMHGPSSCLIDSCIIGDTKSTAPCVGIGCSSGYNAMFTRNVASNNGAGYSYGIPNAYDGRFDILRNIVSPMCNISYPAWL